MSISKASKALDIPVQDVNMLPNSDIVITKWIALEATCLIAANKSQMLKERFSWSFIENINSMKTLLNMDIEENIAKELEAPLVYPLGKGGVFAGLWNMAESFRGGIDVDLSAIPIRQETIEVCELFGISPYRAASKGSLLIVCANGLEMTHALLDLGVNAVITGKTTTGSARILRTKTGVRYLNRPQPDELDRILKWQLI